MTMNDPYISPDGVLRNRLGIADSSELEAAEADITAARENALRRRRVHGDYDLAHLRAFHRFIFGDIYNWAGELRTVDIAKYDAFCRSVHIESYADEIFGKLTAATWLTAPDRDAFVAGLAEAYADINALHPFREGNGRAQRAFLKQLSADVGRTLAWAGLDPAQNEAASIAGFRGDLEPLVVMLDKHVLREG